MRRSATTPPRNPSTALPEQKTPRFLILKGAPCGALFLYLKNGVVITELYVHNQGAA